MRVVLPGHDTVRRARMAHYLELVICVGMWHKHVSAASRTRAPCLPDRDGQWMLPYEADSFTSTIRLHPWSNYSEGGPAANWNRVSSNNGKK